MLSSFHLSPYPILQTNTSFPSPIPKAVLFVSYCSFFSPRSSQNNHTQATYIIFLHLNQKLSMCPYFPLFSLILVCFSVCVCYICRMCTIIPRLCVSLVLCIFL